MLTTNFTLKLGILLSMLLLNAPISFAQNNTKDLVKTLSSNTLVSGGLAEIIADFNGDGIKDIAVIVELSQTNASGLKSIKSHFSIDYLCGTPAPCTDDIDSENSALLIIHGKNKGWELRNVSSFKMKSGILLRGRSNVYAFQKSRFSEKVSGMKIVKGKNGKVWLEFSTEASEGILKWKAGKYTWYETEP
jgi:hypothetical protein